MDTEQLATVEDFFEPAPETDDAAAPGDNLELLDVGDEPDPEEVPIDETGDEDAPEEIEEEEPTPATIAMPSSWSKEDAKAWAALTPEAQAVVARRETERDGFVRKAGWEATNARDQMRRNAAEAIARQEEAHAAALQVYAQQFTAQQPDQSLLYTGNPDDVLTYQRQDAAYRAAAAQQQTLQQAVARAQQQALDVRTQQSEAERQADAQRLQEQLPEWFDTSTGPELRRELQSIGSELGYPVELMAEAGSVDILALKKAADWKAKAKKYDKLVSKRMETVRAAKGLPKMARPGSTPGRGQQTAQAASRRTEALHSFSTTRSGADAAALLFERKR